MPRKETVTRVIDGRTFETARRKRPVRLSNVEHPDNGWTDFGAIAPKLKALIEGERVTIQAVARDFYGRTVAHVRVDGKSVNAAMRAAAMLA